MTRQAIISGIFLFIGGLLIMPQPLASPEEIGDSLAPVAFFYGGTFLISGLFSIKHPRHGTAALLTASFMGILYGGYIMIWNTLPLNTFIVMAILLTSSTIVFLTGLRQHRKKRREANLRRLEEFDGESESET